MALSRITTQTMPSTPSAGTALIYVDSTAKILCVKDDAGRVAAYSQNAAIAAQGAGFAADTYVTNSGIIIPSFGFQAKTSFYWCISASKSGAGIAQPIYVIRVGPNQSTADTARLTLTGPAQTAIADIGTLNIMLTVRSIGATGVIQGTAFWTHRGTAANTTISGTGFANDSTGHIEGTSGAIDMTAFAGQYVGLSMNGGTSAAWTLTQAQVEVLW